MYFNYINSEISEKPNTTAFEGFKDVLFGLLLN